MNRKQQSLKRRIERAFNRKEYDTFKMEVSRGRWAVLSNHSNHLYLCHFHFKGQKHKDGREILHDDFYSVATTLLGYINNPQDGICVVCDRPAPTDIKSYFLLRQE